MGAVLRLPLREASCYFRRRGIRAADDGRRNEICAVEDEPSRERNADRADHDHELVVRTRGHLKEQIAYQLAYALRQEVEALEQAGIGMIQVDEPAVREGLPLKEEDQAEYLAWAVKPSA